MNLGNFWKDIKRNPFRSLAQANRSKRELYTERSIRIKNSGGQALFLNFHHGSGILFAFPKPTHVSQIKQFTSKSKKPSSQYELWSAEKYENKRQARGMLTKSK